MSDVLVIGAGPAGLMAAERLAQRGRRVTVLEAKPSPARKFLMAGKSGLNITRNEPLEAFLPQISAPWLRAIVAEFGPAQVMAWAEGLGQELFTGSTGRVFPQVMKASPLLRNWLARLDTLSVSLQTRARWCGFAQDGWLVETPSGQEILRPQTTVLALGGASWPRLGSDAMWAPWLAERGVRIAPFKPANMGLLVNWSGPMAAQFGQPIKGAALHAGGQVSRGEFVISARGLEGGGLYALVAAVRDGAALSLDLLPDMPAEALLAKLTRPRGKESLSNFLRKTLRLDPAKLALLMEFGRPLPLAPEVLTCLIKSLPIRHAGPRPLAEAISSAGGIAQESLTESLELKALPRVYACGEMLDWEAPTGGYLLTTCLATGAFVGEHAV